MNLQISFDMTDLSKALEIAHQVHEFADILEVGTLLMYSNGIEAINRFKESFEDKIIFTDTKIADRGKESANVFARAKSNWISVLAGTNNNVIHATCSAAHDQGIKVMLDLLDAKEYGQAALEAKNLGIDALLLHEPYDIEQPLAFLDKWDLVRSNTELPIYISAFINRENIKSILHLKPDGVIIGRSITESENPREQAEYFYNLIKERL